MPANHGAIPFIASRLLDARGISLFYALCPLDPVPGGFVIIAGSLERPGNAASPSDFAVFGRFRNHLPEQFIARFFHFRSLVIFATMQAQIIEQITQELSVARKQVAAAVALLDEGATVPFVSRYRKEATGGLDDGQLRTLEDRLGYLRELEDRRAVVLNSIREQGKLTPDLEKAIEAADTKTRLEDLYLPYKPKRRTKAQIAREAGLEPLALALLEDPTQIPESLARGFIVPDKGFGDVKAVLDGARQILMERFAEDAELLGRLREYLWENAVLKSSLVAGKEEEGAKFSDYFDFSEAVDSIPSHRVLALFRARNEGVLNLELVVDPETTDSGPCEQTIAAR